MAAVVASIAIVEGSDRPPSLAVEMVFVPADAGVARFEDVPALKARASLVDSEQARELVRPRFKAEPEVSEVTGDDIAIRPLTTPFDPVPPEADFLVAAGDIGVGLRGLEFLHRLAPLPVIYVAGNHEYYGEAMPRLTQKLRDHCAGSNIHFL